MDLDSIITGLLSGDNELIRAASIEMIRAYENPQTLEMLREIMVSDRPSATRQYATVLLKARIFKKRQAVPLEQRKSIYSCAIEALLAEKYRKVATSMVQLIACISRQNDVTEPPQFPALLLNIIELCKSIDPNKSEKGAWLLSTMVEVIPVHFARFMESMSKMFSTVFKMANTSENFATPTIAYVLSAMSTVLAYICISPKTEKTISESIPLVLKSVNDFALKKGNVNFFRMNLDFMDTIVDYLPSSFNKKIETIIHLTLSISENAALDSGIRSLVISFVGRIARNDRKTIVKLNFLIPIITTIFEVMCSELDEKSLRDFFTVQNSATVLTATVQAFDALSENISSKHLVPPVWQIVENSLQKPNPKRRCAALLALAAIVESCADAIYQKYLEQILYIIKSTISDGDSIVRIGAFFVFEQLCQHLGVKKLHLEAFTLFIGFLKVLSIDLKNFDSEPPHMDRIFVALEDCCETLSDEILPYLDPLLKQLFELLDSRNSINVSEIAMKAITSIVLCAKTNIVPYIPRFIDIWKSYLVENCDEDMNDLRIEAMFLLSAAARVVGKHNFAPLIPDSLNYCLLMFKDGPEDHPTFRGTIYHLMASLSLVAGDDMVFVFQEVMNELLESVVSTESVTAPKKSEVKEGSFLQAIFNSDSEDEGDDDDLEVENDYIMEKEEAILALFDFAVHSSSSFTPYLQTAFNNVHMVIDHPIGDIRKAAIETLSKLILLINKFCEDSNIKTVCDLVIPELVIAIRCDTEKDVVVVSLESLYEILTVVGKQALSTSKTAELLLECIKDIFLNASQMVVVATNDVTDKDNLDETELEQLLAFNATKLVPQFGRALSPSTFVNYFDPLCEILTDKLTEAKILEVPHRCELYYDTINDCFPSLGPHLQNFFDILLPLYIMGTTDKVASVRQSAYLGIGELVLASKEKSYEAFPEILQSLSDASTKEDNIVAGESLWGALARLIVTNHNLMPLDTVLPVFMRNLPLSQNTSDHKMIHKAFRVLFNEAGPVLFPYIEQMLAVTIHALHKKDITDAPSIEDALKLMKEICEQFPEQYNSVIHANEDVFNFVQTL